jgi:hypothetical protein
VEVLELKNKSLLSKWLFKLLNEDGMWQELLHKKYLRSKTLSQVSASPTDSPFWKGLMNVKEDFFPGDLLLSVMGVIQGFGRIFG